MPNDAQSAQFAQWFLDVGHGKDLSLDHTFALPEHMICGPETSDLIQNIYPDVEHGDALQHKYSFECAILCPRNVEVDEINTLVFNKFPGDGRLYPSADSVKGSEREGQLYPVEYLNSINMGGLPPSQLEVK